MAADVEKITRMKICLINSSTYMTQIYSKLQSIEDNELAIMRHLVKVVDEESDVIEDKKVVQIIQEIRDVDVFNFDRDVMELMKNIESSQATLNNYISALKRLV